MLKQYRNEARPELSQLMEKEPVTYSVLINILKGACAETYTDGVDAVICHSAHPWPVWVWCRDVSDDSVVREIGDCLMKHFPVERGFDIIMCYALLEKLRNLGGYFCHVREGMGLLSYRLDRIRSISYPCEGSMGCVRESEICGLIDIWQDMHMEMEGRTFTPEHCERSIRRMVGEKSLFAWRDRNGEIVALTGRGDQPPYSKITSVYTLPRYRRKGYAINLVHGVTKTILEDGLIPILYTDAGYEASNACYQKIGYELAGRLTSICK